MLVQKIALDRGNAGLEEAGPERHFGHQLKGDSVLDRFSNRGSANEWTVAGDENGGDLS
jgi:hypothetical protein